MATWLLNYIDATGEHVQACGSPADLDYWRKKLENEGAVIVKVTGGGKNG